MGDKDASKIGFSSRVLGVVESELRKQLSFGFVIEKNHDRPDARELTRGDRIRLKVYAFNHSGFMLKRVEGIIRPGYSGHFSPKPFRMASLRPMHKAHIATIEAKVVSKDMMRVSLDQLGTVSVSASADLSDVRVTDVDRPLVYATAPSRQKPSPVSPARRGSETNRSFHDGLPPRSIPLSS